MARNYASENLQLSRFGVLVAQLESIVASAAHKPPDGILCFDLLSDLISAIEEEPKESVLQWQRKCEDTLYLLLVLGARRPVRHLASVAMAKIILKGDPISIYSRASSLQGFLSDGKRSDSKKVAGASQCLGELYRYFGRRIISGLLETTNIVAKLLKFSEDFVRQEALRMLHNALEGSDGSAASAAYTEAFRVIMRVGVGDKSPRVKIAAARCLKAFANIGGPGLGIGEIENCLAYCVKALEDPLRPVRDAFSDALGALLALGMNPDAQVQPRGKGHATPKKLEGGLQKHLTLPFAKGSIMFGGPRLKDVRIGISLSWVCFLQAMCLKYLQPDSELQNYTVLVMDMIRLDTSIDAQALACVLYVLRVGITDQMSEPIQRAFSVFLAKQLLSPDSTPSMRVAVLRTLSYVLKTLGEVPLEFKQVLDDTVVAALSHNSALVRVEAALTLRTLAEVDPSCVGGLISYAVTMLSAARENVSFEKGPNFKRELDSLHGLAAVLASLVSTSRKLPLGYPTRLPHSILDVCKNLLTESRRNPKSASIEKEAGWNLLSSLLTSVPKEELKDQVFDILALWASPFSGNKHQKNQVLDLTSEIGVWSAAIDALTSCIKCFLSSDPADTILLQPVLLYLNGALALLSQLPGKEQAEVTSSMDLFTVRVLSAYQALSDPSLYKSDHASIIKICTTPFREAPRCDESSCLRVLLDKRDAWLGPWTPGRDWFEDELRSFQGGRDGVLTCLWENELPSFPQPETISKMLVNQMLLSFGTMFASQDSKGMLSFLSMVDQCLKAGKRQAWHSASVTNVCVGLLAGFKTLLAQRSEPLGIEILTAAQSIFQSILAEGDICASQRRASAEGLGLLARLGNDVFTARLTKQLLADVTGNTDSHYAGSIALALGCIHCSAGGMALSSLVPNTVNVVSSLARSSISGLQIWSLHGLLLTIEAAGLSYVSQVQATLGLVMEIILSEESGWVDLQQAVGRLINAIVAVTGPELAPGSIFFSRCKSAVAEISSCQETATLLESVRFTQQLVLFAPQAVPVHSHVLTLLPTLSSRQPTLRHLALSTLRHLIEKDPVSIIDGQIEETLFYMLDEETDPEIVNLGRSTIMRLLHASCPSRPSRWLSICRNMILSTSRHNTGNSNNTMNDSSTVMDGEGNLNVGNDDENMVSSSKTSANHGHASDYSRSNFSRDKHLRYRTRVFAAECLNHLPEAVGDNPSHFDLSLARGQPAKGHVSGDWLVLQLQELISLAYQISTIQFEKMRPIGVSLLCTIMDKFAAIPDPELPGHVLLEQYQAQLVSAVRSALDSLSGPILLEAGLQLATKMLTSGIISRDQVAVKRIFSLISRPLDDFNDLYYPSYAEWVSCKIKVRLLTVHASLKCYMFASLREQVDQIPDEYLSLLPLFAKSSNILGSYWLSFLKDYSIVHFHLRLDKWEPFLDGIQSSVVSAELHPCLEEAWPVILQALVLDAVPANSDLIDPKDRTENIPTSGYSMVELQIDDFNFLWGFLLMVLFQEQDASLSEHIIPGYRIKSNFSSSIFIDDSSSSSSSLKNVFFSVFQFMSTKRFFCSGYLSLDACTELLQVFSYLTFGGDKWDYLAVFFLAQVVQKCPNDFLQVENFTYLATELCLTSLFKFLLSCNENSEKPSGWEKVVNVALVAASTLVERSEAKMQLKLLLPLLLLGYKCIGQASTEMTLSRISYFCQTITSSLKKLGESELEDDSITHLVLITRACVDATITLTNNCVQEIHQLEEKRSNLRKVLLLKLAYSVEQLFTYAALVYTFEDPGESQEMNAVFYRVLQLSIQCIRAVLTGPDIQVRAVGLQVVKVILQKAIGAEPDPFLIFYFAELVEYVFIILHNILKNPINREAVAIAGECLKIFMLLQTLSKDCDYEKGLIHLILESVLMISLASDGSLSQEANDLRDMAVKLVSQLAQTPSSAASIRDILLAMPATQRQQLQDIIRASVIQDKNPQPITSTGSPLVIKLPSQTEQIGVKNSLLSDPPEKSNQSSVEVEDEDEEDEEDDWDTFQSFPASGNETVPAPDRSPSVSGYNSGEDSDEIGHFASATPSNEESLNIKHHEVGYNKAADVLTPEDDTSNHQLSVEALLSADEELLPNIQSDQIEDEHIEPSVIVPSIENIQPVSDVQPTDIIDSSDEHHLEYTENTESYDSPSDEHIIGTSQTYNHGGQPTELSSDHGEPSDEQRLDYTERTESHDHPSDETYDQGGQPTELSGQNDEPSSERLPESTDSPKHANSIVQDIPVITNGEFEETSPAEGSKLEDHERTSDSHDQSIVHPTDDSHDDSTLAEK